MARFHVHRMREDDALVLDLQADLLDDVETCVVAPLVLAKTVQARIAKLSPTISFEGREYIVWVPQMTAVPRKLLSVPLADVSDRRDAIVAATDFLFQGF